MEGFFFSQVSFFLLYQQFSSLKIRTFICNPHKTEYVARGGLSPAKCRPQGIGATFFKELNCYTTNFNKN